MSKKTKLDKLIRLYLSERGGGQGPVVAKLKTSLVNDSLKFTSSDMQIC